MKKIFFMGVLGMYLLGSCTTQSNRNDGHDSHDHASTEAHDNHNHDEADGHDHDEHAGESDDHDHGTEGKSDEIILSPEKAQAAGIVVEEIQPCNFQQALKVSGSVQSAQGTETTVVATVAGIARFQGMLTPGMQLRKGKDVLHIAANEMPEGDPAARARVAFEAAKAEYERAGRLIDTKIVSQKEYELIRERYERTRLAYEAVAQNETANGIAVRVPMNGYIKNIQVKEGDYVTVGQPLFTVTQNNRLFLRAEVSERYYSALKDVVSANFMTPYDNKLYELDKLNGRLISAGKTAGEGSYYLPVTFCFNNTVDVVPGSFVEVYLLSKIKPNTLALPVEALTEEQGLYFIYTQQCKESYKKQEVTLGNRNGREVEILSGVHPGDKVVVRGAYHVKLASASGALPVHSHEH